uniref:Uncharacterized protein n=1 Tax=Arundo donax TaxID=35708 RepID=A0A0A8YFW5_ARUDO
MLPLSQQTLYSFLVVSADPLFILTLGILLLLPKSSKALT